jgi:hypothetical protein
VPACGWCLLIPIVIGLAFGHQSPAFRGLSACLLRFGDFFSYAILGRVFCREQLWLDPRGIDYVLVDWLVFRRRVIAYPEIRRLTCWRTMTAFGGEQYGLAIETLGRTLRVGRSRDSVEVDQLRENLLSPK